MTVTLAVVATVTVLVLILSLPPSAPLPIPIPKSFALFDLTPNPVSSDQGVIVLPGLDNLVTFTRAQNGAGIVGPTQTNAPSKFRMLVTNFPKTSILYTPDFTNVTSVSVTGTAVLQLVLAVPSTASVSASCGVAWTLDLINYTSLGEVAVIFPYVVITTVNITFSGTFTALQLQPNAGSLTFLPYIRPDPNVEPISMHVVSVAMTVTEV